MKSSAPARVLSVLIARGRRRRARGWSAAARSASASRRNCCTLGEERVARGEHLGPRDAGRTGSRSPSASATARGRARDRPAATPTRPGRAGRSDSSSRICRLSRRTPSRSIRRLSRCGSVARSCPRAGAAARPRASSRRRDRRARASRVREVRHSASVRPAPRSRSIGPSEAAVAERRRARAPQRAAHAVGRILQRAPAASRGRPWHTGAPPRGSVSTTNSGSTPASTGRSRKSSAQNPWMVLTCASSSVSSARSSRARVVSSRASARARSSASRSRSFSSPAAFSVKVTATISSIVARPVARTRRMRFTSSVVLPVPAAASTTSVVSRSSAIARRASASEGNARTRLIACLGAPRDPSGGRRACAPPAPLRAGRRRRGSRTSGRRPRRAPPAAYPSSTARSTIVSTISPCPRV